MAQLRRDRGQGLLARPPLCVDNARRRAPVPGALPRCCGQDLPHRERLRRKHLREAEARLGDGARPSNEPPILLHSGIVYPEERNPTELFQALGRLRAAGAIQPGDFKLRFRAAVHDDLLRRLAAEHAVEAFIEIAPPIPYADALTEMLQVAALVIMQSSNCNDQVPAKVYEYLRARRPVLALTDPQGDTAAVARASGIDAIVPLNDVDALCEHLPAFLRRLRDEPKALVASEAAVLGASRWARTRDLATLLDAIP